jgi:hypothetical protein
MTGSRPGRVWGLVASQAAGRGGRVSAADVCAAAVAAVEVTGAWLSAARGAEAGHLMRVTDEVSEQLAELHLTLWGAISLLAPVTCVDRRLMAIRNDGQPCLSVCST